MPVEPTEAQRSEAREIRARLLFSGDGGEIEALIIERDAARAALARMRTAVERLLAAASLPR